MPWCQQSLERSFTKCDHITIIDERFDRGLLTRHLYLKYSCEARRITQYRHLIRMYLQTDVIGIGDQGIAGYVIHMAVRIDEAHGLEAHLIDRPDEFCTLSGIATTRIDDDALHRFIIDHIGIFLKGSEGQF